MSQSRSENTTTPTPPVRRFLYGCETAEEEAFHRRVDEDLWYYEQEREWLKSRPTRRELREIFGIKVARSGRRGTGADKESVREKVEMERVLDALGIAHRRLGDTLHFICPSHKDTRPSATASRKKKVVFCHSCGWGADCFGLWMKVTDCSFSAAVSELDRI